LGDSESAGEKASSWPPLGSSFIPAHPKTTPRLLLGTMRVALRSHRILRGKSIAESALYLGTLSVGLSLMTKDDASLFANFPFQSFMSCTVMTW